MPTISGTAGLGVVALVIALAAVYMLILRLVDVNEKEPAWALTLVFTSGAASGFLLYVLVPSATLELTPVLGPLLKVAAVIVALAAGLVALDAIGRGRGGSEVSGALDGLVYGAAAGLGFATGSAFVQQLVLSAQPFAVEGDLSVIGPGTLWTLAVSGLAYAVFGGVAGAGFGAAYVSDAARRTLLVAAGVLGAGASAVLYTLLAYGGTLTSAGQLRANIALALPVAVLVTVAVVALRRERRAITAQLDGEVDAGTITAVDARLLRSLPARRGAYLRCLARRDVDGWGDMRALHNHEVRLLIAKDRAARASDPVVTARTAAEVSGLRAAIAAIRAENPSLQLAASTPVGG